MPTDDWHSVWAERPHPTATNWRCRPVAAGRVGVTKGCNASESGRSGQAGELRLSASRPVGLSAEIRDRSFIGPGVNCVCPRSGDCGQSSPNARTRSAGRRAAPWEPCSSTNWLSAPSGASPSSRRVEVGRDQDARELRVRRRAEVVQGPRHGAGQWGLVARQGGHDPDLRPARRGQKPHRLRHLATR